MQVRLTTNAKKTEKALKKKGKNVGARLKKALSITAQKGVNIIENRTADGVGYKDGAFKKYSEKYEAFRESRGRSDKPDLNFTGKMLGSMTTKANRREANIFFTRAAEAKKAAMNNKTRPFFGFSKSEEKQLGKVFFRYLK